MSNEIIPYPNIPIAEKKDGPCISKLKGINQRTLKMMGCNCKNVRIIHGGRGKGKMMAAKEFLKLLSADKQEDIVIIRASDPIPELRGNRLPLLRLLPIEWFIDERQD